MLNLVSMMSNEEIEDCLDRIASLWSENIDQQIRTSDGSDLVVAFLIGLKEGIATARSVMDMGRLISRNMEVKE